MKNRESRRIVPVSIIALIVIGVLFLFETLVVGGVFEVKASTVAKVAPWAYEPFLKMIGEHPDSYRQRQEVQSVNEPRPETSTLDLLKGLNPVVPASETNDWSGSQPDSGLEQGNAEPPESKDPEKPVKKEVVPVG